MSTEYRTQGAESPCNHCLIEITGVCGMDRELARAQVRLQTPHRHGARRSAGCETGAGEGELLHHFSLAQNLF